MQISQSEIGTIMSIVAFSKAPAAANLYAFINPPTPSLVPPKYLTTTTKTLVKSYFSICFKIGGPDELLGSPSSELRLIKMSLSII